MLPDPPPVRAGNRIPHAVGMGNMHVPIRTHISRIATKEIDCTGYYVCVYLHKCVCFQMNLCLCVFICICKYHCVYIYIYIYVNIYINICACVQYNICFYIYMGLIKKIMRAKQVYVAKSFKWMK